MTGELYLVIAIGVAVVVFIGGVLAAMSTADDGLELFLLLMLAVCGAAMAALIWPAAMLVGIVWCVATCTRWHLDRREHEMFWPPERPESDAEKYLRMAREQRELARLHRKTPELASLHEQTALQYEGLARVYADEAS